MAIASDPVNKVMRQDVPQALREVSTTKRGDLGGVLEYSDGRRYRYCSTDSDITIATAVQVTLNVAAIAATYFGVDSSTAPAAAQGGAVGDSEIAFTADLTGITKDEFAGGYLVIDAGTGLGQSLRVRKNDASPSTGSYGLIYLYGNDKLAIALDSTSTGQLFASPYADVAAATNAAANAAQSALIVGRANMTTTAGTDSTTEYLWVQTDGVGAYVSDDGLAGIGSRVGIAVDDAGSVEVLVSNSGTMNHQDLGVALNTMVDAAAGPVLLTPQGF